MIMGIGERFYWCVKYLSVLIMCERVTYKMVTLI